MEETGSSNGLDGYTALITAGGIGTRLLPFSKEIPKEMLPIIAHDRDDSLELKPLVQAIFEQLFSAGIRTFYIVVGRGKRAIEDHFSPDPRFLEFLEKKSKLPRGMSDFYEKVKSSKLVFLNQPEPLGFGDAVLLGQSLIDGPFIVQAADTIQRLAVAGKKVIGVLLQGDELMLDLGSPETMIEALKLSLRYADEKGHAAPEAAKPPLIPRPPRRRAAEIGSLRDSGASLPALVTLMIEWRTARGREPAAG